MQEIYEAYRRALDLTGGMAAGVSAVVDTIREGLHEGGGQEYGFYFLTTLIERSQESHAAAAASGAVSLAIQCLRERGDSVDVASACLVFLTVFVEKLPRPRLTVAALGALFEIVANLYGVIYFAMHASHAALQHGAELLQRLAENSPREVWQTVDTWLMLMFLLNEVRSVPEHLGDVLAECTNALVAIAIHCVTTPAEGVDVLLRLLLANLRTLPWYVLSHAIVSMNTMFSGAARDRLFLKFVVAVLRNYGSDARTVMLDYGMQVLANMDANGVRMKSKDYRELMAALRACAPITLVYQAHKGFPIVTAFIYGTHSAFTSRAEREAARGLIAAFLRARGSDSRAELVLYGMNVLARLASQGVRMGSDEYSSVMHALRARAPFTLAILRDEDNAIVREFTDGSEPTFSSTDARAAGGGTSARARSRAKTRSRHHRYAS